MKIVNLKKYKLPDKPGVYFFMKGRSILYIGKATSLRDRTKSYFSKDLIVTRGPAILDMVVQADKIKYQETGSVLEALILEAELIKKYQPKYNIKEKDDKSWNYVCITREELPKVLIIRGKDLKNRTSQNFFQVLGSPRPNSEGLGQTIQKFLPGSVFGPYTNGLQLREALKIIRRIFPYFDSDSIKKNNKKFYEQIGLTPDSKKEYQNNIKNIKLFFQGKKKKIIQNLKKEMMLCAKMHEFEKAGEIKKKIFALNHINDVALIKGDNFERSFLKEEGSDGKGKFLQNYRIEAYDVAHMSGKNMVGVMVVILNGQVQKSEYKKFIIKTQNNANDTGALEEVLSRRLRHTEWGMPSLIVVDGSTAQINIVDRVLLRYQIKIPIVSVVKDESHKAKAIKGETEIIKHYKKDILLANSEAHRFAINFYRAKSRKNMFK